MFRFVRTAATTALVLALAAPAMAEVSYPRTVGSGENSEIDYGPSGRGNIVGGGVARSVSSGENSELIYEGPVQSQTPMFAHSVGSGEDAQIVYSRSPDRETALAEAGVFPHGYGAPASALASLLQPDHG